jgi:hypothetical protein
VALGGCLVGLAYLPFGLRFLDVFWIERAREGSVLWSGGGLLLGPALPAVVGLDLRAGVLPGFWLGLLPLLAAVGLAGARLLRSRPLPEPVRAPARLATAWIALSLGFLFLRAVPASWERYWANLLVPMACLVAIAADPALRQRTASRQELWGAAALLAIGPVLLVRQAIIALAGITTDQPVQVLARIRFTLPIVLVAVAILWPLIVRFGWTERLTSREALAAALLAATVGAGSVLAAMASPTFTVRDASRALQEDGSDKVLTGDLGNTLAFETRYSAFACRDLAAEGLGSGWLNGDWRARGATHWVSDAPPGATSPAGRTPAPSGAALMSVFPVWPDRRGTPRLTVYVSLLPVVAPEARRP